MARLSRQFLFVTTALGLSVALPVQAQTAVAADAPRKAKASGSGDVADIIVTARRTDERLQDVPISITVYNQAQLSARNVTDANDLALYTPSLSVTGTLGKENAQYAIRGFVQEKATTASVGVYFAEVVAPRAGTSIAAGDGAGPGSFFDLQNVQVLKGPQGTLFGRNTTGGAILLVPQKPTGQFEGYAEGLYGDYNWVAAQAVMNVPLGEHARARFGVDYQNRDGYTQNVVGRDLDDRNYISARASLVVDLTPDLETYFIGSFTRSSTHGSAAIITACNPFSVLGDLQCGAGNGASSAFSRQQARGPRAVEQFDNGTYNKTRQWQLINTTTYNASDTLTIKNIASYTQLTTDYRSEVFGGDSFLPPSINVFLPVSPFVIPVPTGQLAGTPISFVDVYPARNRHTNDQQTFTEELQFQGQSSDGRLKWQAGGYYEYSSPLSRTGTLSTQLINCTNLVQFQCFDALGAIYSGVFGRPVPVGGIGERTTEITYRNLGIYTQGTYALSDQFKVTGGLRYTWDRVKGNSQATRFRFGLLPNNAPFADCVFPTLTTPVSPFDTSGSGCRVSSTVSSNKPTWLIDLDYTPSKDVLIYAKYARGYRQASVSPDAAEGYQTFQPEKVDSYEVGLKSSFRAGGLRGSLNAAGFYNDFSNQQLSAVFTPNPFSGLAQADGIVNAGKSRIYGAEVGGTLYVAGFDLGADYTYLNTKLISLQPIVLPAGSIYETATATAVAGKPLIYSPRNKATATLGYTLPVSDDFGTIRLAGTYTYVSSQYANVGSAFGQLPSYGLLNVNFDWRRVAGSQFDLSLFATNVTDKLYAVYTAGIFETAGIGVTRYGEPRMYGVKVRFHFKN